MEDLKDEAMKDFLCLMKLAFKEDLGEDGDVTSLAIFERIDVCKAYLVSKDDGVLFGMDYFKRCFLERDPNCSFLELKHDGDKIYKGDCIIEINGRTCAILEAERTSLNFLAFLSGISTKANSLCGLAGETLILDTRKTLPGYRRLSKLAVITGGLANHRMGLFDMVMIKDNHIDAVKSIENAVLRVKERYGLKYKIEIEARSEEDVLESILAGVDVVMLDNMDVQDCKSIVAKYKGRVKFECSGDMDKEKIEKFREVNADYISVGALTHSVKSFNFSLKIER